MKKVLVGFLICFGILVLTACGGEERVEEPQFLDVVLTISPETPQPNETVTFEAKVTYGSEEVTDADEVKFEIWRANDEDHEKFEIEHAENGIYRLEKTFEREGTYYIISHVTGRSMHNMPKEEFVVGKPSEPEGESSKQNDMDMEHESTDH